jgi:hypothetical protein
MKTEKQLQNYLKRQCGENNILYYKFSSPAKRGVPDVILVHCLNVHTNMPDRVRFVELKSPSKTGRLSALQLLEIANLRDAGAIVHVIETVEQVDNIIKALKT